MAVQLEKFPPCLLFDISLLSLLSCLLQYKGTDWQLLSPWLHLLGESEQESSVNLCQGSLNQDKENETEREKAASLLLVVILSLYDANHM